MPVENLHGGPVLCIICPQIGAVSETFIKRHIDLLAPGKTVVLTGQVLNSAWVSCPVEQIPISLGRYHFGPDVEAKVISFLDKMAVTHILCEFGCIGGAVLALNKSTLHLPSYVHFHGQDASEFLKMPEIVDYYHWMGQTVDGVIAVSQPMRDRLIGIGIPPEKLCIIHYGVDVPQKCCSHPEVDPCRLIAVSRLVPKKGLIQTLMAFERALDADSTITLDVIGDGSMRTEIEAFIEAHHLRSSVKLHGFLEHSEVFTMMDASSIFVQHSMIDPVTGNREGTPVSIIEAAAHALPVVSTRHEGIPETVEDGISGYLVGEGDWMSMADFIVKLVKDPGLRRKMGLAGRKKIMESGFSTESNILELRRFMEFFTNESSC